MVAPVTRYDASTGLMCFAAALVSMREGSKVRREGWPEGHWVGIEQLPNARHPRLYYRLPDGYRERWMRPMEDILAEDWEEALIPYDTVNP